AQRSVARAAGGRRDVVPISAGVRGWLKRCRNRASRRRCAGLRRAPWERGCVPHSCVPASPEQRTGADRPQRQLFPMRVLVRGGRSSPRAFGGPHGGWSARRGTPQRGGVRVAQSARKPCQLSEVCGTPPGRPGSGAMWPGRVRYPHRTTHWSGRATVGIRGRRGAVHVARRSPPAFGCRRSRGGEKRESRRVQRSVLCRKEITMRPTLGRVHCDRRSLGGRRAKPLLGLRTVGCLVTLACSLLTAPCTPNAQPAEPVHRAGSLSRNSPP